MLYSFAGVGVQGFDLAVFLGRVRLVGAPFQGSGVRDQGSGCRGQGSGCRGRGSGCRGQDSGCRGQGSRRSTFSSTRPPDRRGTRALLRVLGLAFIRYMVFLFRTYGLWFMAYGSCLRFMMYGLCFLVHDLWFMVYGLRYVGRCPCQRHAVSGRLLPFAT